MTISLFQTVFEDEIAHEAEELAAALRAAAPPTREELEQLIAQARSEAYEAGKTDGIEVGRAEASAGYDAQFSNALQALVDPINQLLANEKQHQQAVESDLTGLLRSLCEKCMPSLIANCGDIYVDAEIRQISIRAQGSRWLELRINPAHRENAQLVLDAMIQPDGGRVEVRIIDDAELGLTEVKASWHNGRSAYSYEKLCENVMVSLFGSNEALKTELERQDVE